MSLANVCSLLIGAGVRVDVLDVVQADGARRVFQLRGRVLEWSGSFRTPPRECWTGIRGASACFAAPETAPSASGSRRPASGVIHHSDRGSQYASADYQTLLTQHGFIPSMSRKGNCGDNAPMESFFHSLKVEWLHDQTFRTRAAARQAIFTFIEVWYNRQRLHSTLG